MSAEDSSAEPGGSENPQTLQDIQMILNSYAGVLHDLHVAEDMLVSAAKAGRDIQPKDIYEHARILDDFHCLRNYINQNMTVASIAEAYS